MRDNQLIMLFRPLLLAGFAAQGLTTVQVKQNFQPTQQGRVGTPPAMYMTKILDHRHGSPGIKETWHPPLTAMIRTKTEIIEGHWQFSFTVAENPADDNELTAADYAKIAASIMQDDPFRAGLIAAEVNILRITDVRTVNVQNDYDQFEKNVSFDAIITHKDVTVTTTPFATNFTFKLRRV